ncbi:MAG: 23S rRNA (uracil(1939)-C(5))-methyltransferase RlmD [Bacilli bacterium]|nr:23S rRNA (uracil(1939)-C(5))-methyltransferase RlmD [Bacilli bacterium]
MLDEIKIKDKYKVFIKNQDHFGNGITKLKNKLVFVNKALPNEECEIEITNVKKTFAEAKIIDIIKSSDERKEPICPYYNSCGGCNLMHQDFQKQLEYKENKVKEILERFADLNLKDININKIISTNEFNYRNKVVLHFENNNFGFYKEKSNEIVAIDNCCLLDPSLNTIIDNIREYLVSNPKEQIYDMMIRTTNLNETMVVIEGKIKSKIISKMLKDLGVTTVNINGINTLGNGYIKEQIFEQYFQISPSSFFQVNYKTMLKLYSNVVNFYKEKNYNKVLDLYCGTGTIGMLLTPYVNKVIGIEIEKSSIIDAKNNKLINDISNIEFIKGKVEEKIERFMDIDSIIVDPPRSGLDTKTIKAIMNIKPESICYISCDPVTLSRDLKVLLTKYDIEEVSIYDMFSNTYHVETLVKLNRK